MYAENSLLRFIQGMHLRTTEKPSKGCISLYIFCISHLKFPNI